MRRFLQLVLFTFLITVINTTAYAQLKKLPIDDQLIQDSIYKSNKKKVLNFSMKDFNALFLEYFKRKNDPDVVLSKKEFYSYTVKIATFSDRLASLYTEEKQVAEKNKETWLAESYEDYLQYKASQKK